MEIFQWEEQDFFSKLTFHVNETFKTWGKCLQLPYANQAKFYLNNGLSSHKQPSPVSAYSRFDYAYAPCHKNFIGKSHTVFDFLIAVLTDDTGFQLNYDYTKPYFMLYEFKVSLRKVLEFIFINPI